MLHKPVRWSHKYRSEIFIVSAVLMVPIMLLLAYPFPDMDRVRHQEAKLKMQSIKNAIQTYMTKYGKYPNSLQDLIESTQGDAPLLEGSTDRITDPWGQPFSFSVVPDESGSSKIVVTSQGDGEPLTWPDSRIQAKKP